MFESITIVLDKCTIMESELLRFYFDFAVQDGSEWDGSVVEKEFV